MTKAVRRGRSFGAGPVRLSTPKSNGRDGAAARAPPAPVVLGVIYHGASGSGMKRLVGEDDIGKLVKRISKLTPASHRQWGQMSCAQMVCHLSDAFRGPLGDRPPSSPHDTWVTRTLVKWVALRTPLPWPRGRARTSPEIDQVAGAGTPPGQFAEDVAALVRLMTRFVAQGTSERPAHPVFGRLNVREWRRWGWAHVDHHLRQFGA